MVRVILLPVASQCLQDLGTMVARIHPPRRRSRILQCPALVGLSYFQGELAIMTAYRMLYTLRWRLATDILLFNHFVWPSRI